MKYFQYDFAGIKSWKGKDCYEIKFCPLGRDSSKVQGSMLIDMETFIQILIAVKILVIICK